MAKSPQLAALVERPFELLQELERRSRAEFAGQGGAGLPEEWVGIGFRLGQDQFVASRDQVREVLILPDTMTRVPGAVRTVARRAPPVAGTWQNSALSRKQIEKFAQSFLRVARRDDEQ